MAQLMILKRQKQTSIQEYQFFLIEILIEKMFIKSYTKVQKIDGRSPKQVHQ
jgi:hypothetical protein